MISREEAVKKLSTTAVMVLRGSTKEFEEAIDMAITFLSQPERPKGRWVFEPHPITHNWLYRCTSCNGWEEDTPPFCPNCGADMRDGEEE